MKKLNTRINRITLLLLVFFASGIVFYKFTNFTGYKGMLAGFLQTCLWIGLIIGWCILMRHRLLPGGMRRYLTVMCLFLVLWFLFRGLKYYVFPPETDASRYCWYLYYIPMEFYPTCAICAMTYMGRPEEWKQPAHARVIFIIPAFICILVLTNDFHQMFFRFPENAAIWSDRLYHYGPLYVLHFSWFLISTCITLFIMIRRCRIPRSNLLYARLPILPPVLGLLYSIIYTTGRAGFFSDLMVVMSFCTIWMFESAIRVGYIRSNSSYTDLFSRASIGAQIFDGQMHLKYASDMFLYYDQSVIEKTFAEGSCIQNAMRYEAAPISGGTVIWKEDVHELIQLQQHLESANEYLEDTNMVLKKNYDSKLKRRKLEEQNRLYYEMQSETEEKLNEISSMLAAFSSANEEEEETCLLKLGVLTAYLKRRNNLLFLKNDNHRIPVTELRNCIRETGKMLEVFGISCLIHITDTGAMTFDQMVYLYDAFESVIEETMDLRPDYFITGTGDGMQFALRIRMDGIPTHYSSPALTGRILSREEEEVLLEIGLGQKEF